MNIQESSSHDVTGLISVSRTETIHQWALLINNETSTGSSRIYMHENEVKEYCIQSTVGLPIWTIPTQSYFFTKKIKREPTTTRKRHYLFYILRANKCRYDIQMFSFFSFCYFLFYLYLRLYSLRISSITTIWTAANTTTT